MSNDTYERVFKLWISLWELVLNDKRHLEAVCTTLQKLVFEFKGYPKFRNWSAICEIQDWCLKMVLARVDLDSDEGKRLQTAFPECFTREESRGPIPVSILMGYARQQSSRSGEGGAKYLEFSGALEYFNVPFITLLIDRDSDLGLYHAARISEGELREIGLVYEGWIGEPLDEYFGRIVEYQNHKYFIAQPPSNDLILVPSEVLVLDQ